MENNGKIVACLLIKKMKKSILFLLTILFFSCNVTKKNSNLPSDELYTKCPENGECSIIIHKNKKLNVVVDGTGSKYFQLLDNNETSVIIYEYKKKVNENLQDGNYVEEIIFEIPNDINSLNLKDKELQTTKMIFGRHCYCKGQAGYFNVTTGKLNLIKVDNEIKFELNFKIDEVPQIITSINTIIK
jgi:hypothetical protein